MERSTINRGTFRDAYRSADPPWDIPGPQPALVEVADQVQGKVLDAGCGTGENSLFFASRGCEVTALDYLQKPLQQAAQKAEERKLSLTTRQQSALELSGWSETFDCVIDSGLFHVFDTSDRAVYVAGLKHVTQPGSKLFLLCFSDAEPPGNGPRRITQQELKDSFRTGWQILSLTATRFAVRADLPGDYFTAGGPHAWRLIAERI